ncbi:MAG: aminomethyltransferase beta-barrel domain-containing protein [Butyricimonas faecalis]
MTGTLSPDNPALTLLPPGRIVDESGNPWETYRDCELLNGPKRESPRGQTPQYVSRLSPSTNQIVVGDKTSLFRTTFSLHQVHLIDPEEILSEDIEVKVRGIGLNPEGFARLSFQPDQTLHVQLSSPAWAVAPGQPAVFYRQDRVIGGGIVR